MPIQAADESLFDPRTKILALIFLFYGFFGQVSKITGFAPALDSTQLSTGEFIFWYGATDPLTTFGFFLVVYAAWSQFPLGPGRRYQI